LLDVNRITGQRDIGADAIEARPQVRETRRAIGERDLTEELRLFDRSAYIDIGNDGAARFDQTRNERSE